MTLINLTGKIFGRWKVIQRDPTRARYWLCRCVCGTTRAVTRDNLCYGGSKSCGCLKTELLVARGSSPHITTNKEKDPALKKAYSAWRDMKHRCTCPSHIAYHRYGGRGISVCPRWGANFTAFLADMGAPPNPLSTLDRINNAEGYSPSNCRWATRAEQAVNRSTTRLIQINGVTKSVTDWARFAQLAPTTLWARLGRGWKESDLLLPAKTQRANL